jgi:O-antigen/teichoic acid export membrane protein
LLVNLGRCEPAPEVLLASELIPYQVAGFSDDAKAAARGGLALAALQTASRVLGLAFVLAATHALPADQFGRYSVVAALVLIGGAVADFGTTTVITRRVSRAPGEAQPLLGGTLLASFLLGLVAWGGILAFVALARYPAGTLADVGIGGATLPSPRSWAPSMAGVRWRVGRWSPSCGRP